MKQSAMIVALTLSFAAFALGNGQSTVETNEIGQLRAKLAEQTRRIDRLYEALGPELAELEDRAAKLKQQELEDAQLKLQTVCIISNRNLTTHARFSPVENSFAVVTRKGTVLIFNADGKELRELELPDARLNAIAYAPDGKQLLSGTRDGKVWLHALDTGNWRPLFAWTNRPICHVLWLPNPDRCVVAYDKAVGDYAGFVVRIADGQCLTNFSSRFHIWNYQAVAASADGKWLGVLDTPGRVRAGYLLDSEHCEPKATLLDEEYPSGPLSIGIAPDNNTVAVGYGPWNFSLWDAAKQKELRLVKAHSNWVVALGFSPDSKRVISGAGDSTARVWDATTGAELGRIRFTGGSTYVESVGFSADGNLVLAAAENDTLVVAAAPK